MDLNITDFIFLACWLFTLMGIISLFVNLLKDFNKSKNKNPKESYRYKYEIINREELNNRLESLLSKEIDKEKED